VAISNSGGTYAYSSAVISWPTSAYTILAWFYPDASEATTQVEIPIYFGAAGARDIAFCHGHNSASYRHAFTHRDAGASYPRAQLASSLTAGSWYALGCSWSTGNTMQGYLNGSSSGSGTGTAAPNGGTYPISVGAKSTGANPCAGDVADVALYNVVLDAAEHAAFGAGVSPLLIRPSALLSYTRYISAARDERSGATFTNTSSFATHPRIIYPSRPHIITAPAGAAPAATSFPFNLYYAGVL